MLELNEFDNQTKKKYNAKKESPQPFPHFLYLNRVP